MVATTEGTVASERFNAVDILRGISLTYVEAAAVVQPLLKVEVQIPTVFHKP